MFPLNPRSVQNLRLTNAEIKSLQKKVLGSTVWNCATKKQCYGEKTFSDLHLRLSVSLKIISVASSSQLFLCVNADTAFKVYESVSVCRCGSKIGSLDRSKNSLLQYLLVVQCPHGVDNFTLNSITHAINCKIIEWIFSLSIIGQWSASFASVLCSLE